jgi:asparagine N-glycosylation enzyme membrane subunit Stt3
MSWENIIITVANVGFFVALLPLLLAAFGFRSVELSLIFTATLTALFLILMGVATISLGAATGGSVIVLNAFAWAVIAAGTRWQNKKKKR